MLGGPPAPDRSAAMRWPSTPTLAPTWRSGSGSRWGGAGLKRPGGAVRRGRDWGWAALLAGAGAGTGPLPQGPAVRQQTTLLCLQFFAAAGQRHLRRPHRVLRPGAEAHPRRRAAAGPQLQAGEQEGGAGGGRAAGQERGPCLAAFWAGCVRLALHGSGSLPPPLRQNLPVRNLPAQCCPWPAPCPKNCSPLQGLYDYSKRREGEEGEDVNKDDAGEDLQDALGDA